MMLSKAKLRIKVSPDSIIDVNEIVEILSTNYEIKYCGLFETENIGNIYIQSITRMSSNTVKNLLEGKKEILEIDSFKNIIGTLIEEVGTFRKQGSITGQKNKKKTQTVVNNITNNINNVTNNINVIMVNPIGHESLSHITPEYIQTLLGDTDQDANVIFQFGSKLYSVPENMNFKSSLKVGYVKALVPGKQRAWVTSPKREAFDCIVDNLTEKNLEAVELYGSDVPKEHLEKFHRNLEWITEFKQSYIPEERNRYKRFRNEGLNTLAENINDKKRRLARDTNQIFKLT